MKLSELYPARLEYDENEGTGIIWAGPGVTYGFSVDCFGDPEDEWAVAIVEAINRAHVADEALALVREATEAMVSRWGYINDVHVLTWHGPFNDWLARARALLAEAGIKDGGA